MAARKVESSLLSALDMLYPGLLAGGPSPRVPENVHTRRSEGDIVVLCPLCSGGGVVS